MTAARHFALRYMSRFTCTGSACPDTCCSAGWPIAVDEDHYLRLKKATDKSRADREAFRAAHQRQRGDSRDGFASIRLTPSGSCPLLLADGLCSIHKRFGEDVLGDTCATYPRSLGVAAERRELAGRLSCPEVARLALLDEDAFELDELDLGRLPRRHAHRTLEDGGGPYEAYFDDVRVVMLDIVGRRDLALPVRLFVCAHLGERTRDYFHRGATSLDADRLAVELARVADAGVQDRLGAKLIAAWADADPRPVVELVRALKVEGEAPRARASAGFHELKQHVFAGLVADGVVTGGPGAELAVDVPRLYDVHARWRAPWEGEAELAARLDLAFTNLCRQYWIREWYTSSPDLLRHALQLIGLVALHRLMLFRHPLLVTESTEGERRGVLERALVDLVYRAARVMEHHVKDAFGLGSLAHALPLLRL